MHSSRRRADRSPRPSDGSNDTLAALARLASIVEGSEDAILSKDLMGTILTWNRGAAAIYGYSAAEAVGQSIDILTPPDRMEEERRIIESIRAGHSVQHFETVRLRKGGIPIDVSLSISPIREGVSVVGASHVARDISERKRMEVAMAQLAAIVESSEDAIVSADLGWTIRSWNRAAERIYGYSASEALGQSNNLIIPPECEPERRDIAEKILRGEAVGNFETVRMRKGGERIEVSLTVSPIRGRAGDIVGASHIARPISDRRSLEAGMARLAAIVESSEDAIISKNLDGVIQTWNPGAERVYCYEAEEVIGRNINLLLPPERANEEQEILAKLRRGERIEHFETTRLRKDGELIQISLSISPIRDVQGRVTGASHVARDITQQKAFEEQVRQTQRLESLGVLAGGIAHDFNNLLTGILGNASLIAEDLPSTSPLRPRVGDLTVAAERAAQLTNQMLAYSGKGQFVVGPIHLSQLIAELMPLLTASIPRNVDLRMELDHQAPAIIGDATQIQQLAMNLIINAAEAIVKGRLGWVIVRTGQQELEEEHIRAAFPGSQAKPGRYVFLEVRDNGCGMDGQIKARIFEPFFSTKFTGRGLGLAAALGIVQAHKGAIRVSSTPNEGSTFKVYLPAEGEEARETGTGSPAQHRPAILVVDDEEIVRKVAQVALSTQGYRVLLAANGEEAVDLFRDMPDAITLVLLDLAMPVMDGEVALRALRAIRPGVPVILSSGYTEAEATRRFAGEHLSGFLQKPYTSRQLREKVAEVLERSSATRP